MKTMSDLGSRKGGAEKYGLPMMVLTFVLIAGFLYWLNVTAQPTEVEVVEVGATETGLTTVTLEVFRAGPEVYDGQEIRITETRIASLLGEQAFWAGPDDNPFLVKISQELLEQGVSLEPGSIVTVIGTVTMMSDSVLSAWDEAGAFQSEGDRIVAEFAERFVEIRAVEGYGVEAEGDGTSS
jgi:hypothetical protein